MSGGRDKFAVFPSRCNYVFYRQKIEVGRRGLNLLRGKKDALELKQKEIRLKNTSMREEILNLISEAKFSLAKAKFIGWDLKAIAIETNERPSFIIYIGYTSIAGVQIPTYSIVKNSLDAFPLTGLGRGGQQVINVREDFQRALQAIVRLGFLQSTEQALKEACYKVNIRLNGLEFVMLPKLANTLLYIATELDESDREEIYRLKKSLQATMKRVKQKEKDRMGKVVINIVDESSMSTIQEFYDCLDHTRHECELCPPTVVVAEAASDDLTFYSIQNSVNRIDQYTQCRERKKANIQRRKSSALAKRDKALTLLKPIKLSLDNVDTTLTDDEEKIEQHIKTTKSMK